MNGIHLPQGQPSYSHTLRVTFAYGANGIAVVGVKRVAMLVPAPATPAPSEKSVGYWLSVEDAAGKVLFHVPIHDPLKRDREVFDDPERGKPFRTPSTETAGQFEILVPDMPEGARVVLHGPPLDAKPTEKGAVPTSVPLISHGLEELRRLHGAAERAPGGQVERGRP